MLIVYRWSTSIIAPQVSTIRTRTTTPTSRHRQFRGCPARLPSAHLSASLSRGNGSGKKMQHPSRLRSSTWSQRAVMTSPWTIRTFVRACASIFASAAATPGLCTWPSQLTPEILLLLLFLLLFLLLYHSNPKYNDRFVHKYLILTVFLFRYRVVQCRAATLQPI